MTLCARQRWRKKKRRPLVAQQSVSAAAVVAHFALKLRVFFSFGAADRQLSPLAAAAAATTRKKTMLCGAGGPSLAHTPLSLSLGNLNGRGARSGGRSSRNSNSSSNRTHLRSAARRVVVRADYREYPDPSLIDDVKKWFPNEKGIATVEEARVRELCFSACLCFLSSSLHVTTEILSSELDCS